MWVIRRSVKAILRSPMKSVLMILLLGLSIGLALVMLSVNGAITNQLSSIQGQVGNEIDVRPAGSFANLGGGEALTDAQVSNLSSLSHVTSVQRTVESLFSGSSLVSPINPGRLGARARGILGGNAASLPIVTQGFDVSAESPILLGGAHLQMQEGEYFTAAESNANVALVGQGLATKNSLSIGSTFDVNGTQVEVIGIFSTNQVFGDSILVMPFMTAERLFDISGATSVTLEADSSDNVATVVDEVNQALGSGTVDITTSAETYQRISGILDNASQTTVIAMISAFVIAGAVVLFSVFLSVRQRVKEIGILKAIGASNSRVGLLFGLESLWLSLLAALFGSFVAFSLARPIGRLVVGLGRGGIQSILNNRGAIAGVQLTVSPSVIVLALLVAIVLTVLASILSSWYVGRVKPAEVLRNG